MPRSVDNARHIRTAILTFGVLFAAACGDNPSGVQCSVSSVTVVGLPAQLPALSPTALTAQVSPASCSSLPVQWSASSGLTINSSGQVTAEALGGPLTVTATVGGVQGSAETSVVTAPILADTRWAISWLYDASAATYEVDQTGYTYSFSTGGAIRVARSGAGAYAVTFVGLAAPAGRREAVHVSAYGNVPRRCRVLSWANQGADLVVQVRCNDLAGTPADSPLDILVAPAGSIQGRSAFVLTSSTSGGAVLAATAHNSQSKGISVVRGTTGRYDVTFAGLDRSAVSGSGLETFHITSFGTGTEWCKISGWGTGENAEDMVITVLCFTAAGAPADARFSVLMLERGRLGKRLGYVWANQENSPVSYTPSTTYNFNSATGPNTAIRTSVGVYGVTWPGLARLLPANAETNLITAYGEDSVYCQVSGWGASGVEHFCYAPNGTLTNSRFVAIWIE